MRGRGCAGGLISERALERAGHCVHGAREGSDTDLQPPLNRGAYGSVATETKAPARGVPGGTMRVRQGSGVAQASGPNPMSFPSVNNR